ARRRHRSTEAAMIGKTVLTRGAAALACASTLAAGACRRGDAAMATASAATSASTATEAAATATAGAKATPPRLRLDASQLGQITVEEVSTRAAGGVIHATGTVEFNADRIARILAPVAGQVQGLTLNVGDDVKRGDTVFALS